MAVLLCQKHQIFPAGLKYATTAADLIFLTLILLAASGPQSPLVIGYFLIIVLATLRFSLGLVRFADGRRGGGLPGRLGPWAWFRDPPLTVPRHQQLIMVVGLALTRRHPRASRPPRRPHGRRIQPARRRQSEEEQP